MLRATGHARMVMFCLTLRQRARRRLAGTVGHGGRAATTRRLCPDPGSCRLTLLGEVNGESARA